MADYKVRFDQKSLNAIQTVAELFVYARLERKEERDEIARELQISPFYLEALEEGSYGKLPSYIYSRNFVKTYGEYLGLNSDPLLELFRQEWELFQKHQQPLFEDNQKRGVSRSHLWSVPRWARWLLSGVVVTSMFAYLGMELYELRQPPKLRVDAPRAEMTTDKQLVEITGESEPEVALTINDQTVLSDGKGNFNETVVLQPGLNVIEIQAKKKYSRENTILRKVVVEDDPVFTGAEEEALTNS